MLFNWNPWRLPGGTENLASTRMVRRAGVNMEAEGSQAESQGGSSDATKEGKTKAVSAMFDSMCPVGKGKAKDADDDDDDDGDNGSKRKRRGGAPSNQRPRPEDPEAS